MDNAAAWEQFQWDVLYAMAKSAVTGWIQDHTGWWYRYADGGYPTNAWREIDGKWYWFDGAGYAVENAWYEYDGDWYYLDADCAMATGLRIIDEKVYFFHEDGSMAVEPVVLTPGKDGVLG